MLSTKLPKPSSKKSVNPPERAQFTMLHVLFKEDLKKWTTDITLTNQMCTSSLANGFFIFIFFQTNLSLAPILLQYSHKVNTGQHDTEYWW